MYSKEDNLILIHIPKCAGQTIINHFLQKYKKDDWKYLCADNRKIDGKIWRMSHLTYKQYVRLNILSEEEFLNCKKIAIVRNPYERFLSYFNMIRRKGGIYKNYTIDEHIKKTMGWLKTKNDPHKGYLMTKPMVNFFEKKHKVEVFKMEEWDRILNFFESYDIKITKSYNMNPVELERENINLLPKCIEFVNNTYKEDFERFGYEML